MMSLCSEDVALSPLISAVDRPRPSKEKGLKFPVSRIFYCVVSCEFSLCMPHPSFAPYSASVAIATGGETFFYKSHERARVLSVANNQPQSRVRNCLSNKNRNLLRIEDHDYLSRPIPYVHHEKQPFHRGRERLSYGIGVA